jgi:hypothetical protein
MKPSLVLSILLLLSTAAFSTHLRGGQIRVIPQNNPLTCVVEITVYTDTNSEIKFGDGILDFGDGSTHTTPTIDNTKRPDLFARLGIVTYRVTHSYAATGTYLVSYLEPNLAGGILNMFNSVETRFYLETTIVLTSDHPVASPQFPASPIFICQSQLPYSCSTAAIDSTAREVFYKYSLVSNPKGISNFRLPQNLKIDENTGIITWDTEFEGKFIQGQIWIVVKIQTFSNEGDFLGYVMRAMQIIVEDHDSQIDITSSIDDSNGRVVVKKDEEKVIKVILSDEMYPGNLRFDLFRSKTIKNNVTLTQYDSIAGKKFRVAKLQLKTTSDIVSDLPYAITLRAVSTYWTDISFMYATTDTPPLQVVTGIEDEITPGNQLNVFPNPFQSEVYVEGTEAIFINSIGRIVMRSTLQEGISVNTSALPAGFYILQVVNADGMTRTMRLIRN